MSQLFDSGKESGATFSPCRTWRYLLWRQWDESLPTVMFIGLNPSTADETVNDRTISKCIKFAKTWGFGTYLMGNLYGIRSPYPRDIWVAEDPVGPGHDDVLRAAIGTAHRAVAAWGCESGIDHRANQVLEMIPEPYCLKVTKGGYPWHPLYVPGATEPIRYRTKSP